MDKPATPKEKYEALKRDMIMKGKWNEETDYRIKEFLGLPLVDEVIVEEPVVKVEDIVEAMVVEPPKPKKRNVAKKS